MPKKASEQQIPPHQLPPVPFYTQSNTSNQYRFYLSNEIEEPERYHQMCQILRSVSENDTVFIHLNCPGGRLDATTQIIAAMKESRGDVITVADGVVASAATLIFLAGDGFIVNPHCMFMIHNYSGGAWGKGHEMEAQIHADIRWFNKIAMDFYDSFLTKAEIKKMLKGEDYWFTADEVTTRIQTRVDHLRALQAADAQRMSADRFRHYGEEMWPLLDERQQKQLERLIKCASGKLQQASAQGRGNAEE